MSEDNIMHARLRLLIPLSLLVIMSLSCSLVSNMFTPQAEGGTTPGTVAPPAEPTLASGAVDLATPTEGVRRKVLPPTPTPFAVTSTDDVRSILDLSQPTYVDYFDDPTLWFDYDIPGRAGYKVEDSRLVGVDYDPEEIYTWWSYTDKRADDVYTEMSATNGDCVGKDSVGFVIHSDLETGAGGYSLEVSCDGNFRFRLMRQGKSPVEMIKWTAAPVINTGKEATNRLGIWDSRARLVLFVNGQQVAKVNDPNVTYAWGNFALYVRASQTYNLTVTFDDFAFWKVPYLE